MKSSLFLNRFHFVRDKKRRSGNGRSDRGGRLGEEARSPAEILTPASFGFSGGEYLARKSLPINTVRAVIGGMFSPEE